MSPFKVIARSPLTNGGPDGQIEWLRAARAGRVLSDGAPCVLSCTRARARPGRYHYFLPGRLGTLLRIPSYT